MGEWSQFLNLLRSIGAKHTINWQCKKDPWQKILDDAGHNFTSLASNAIEVNGVEFLFSSFGDGLFILSRNIHTGEIQTHPTRRIRFQHADQMYEELVKLDIRAL